MQPLPQRTMTLFNQLKADHEALLHSHLQSVQQVSESDSSLGTPVQIREGADETPMFIVEMKEEWRNEKTHVESEVTDGEVTVEEVTTESDNHPSEGTGVKRKEEEAPAIGHAHVVKKLRFDQ